MHLNYLSFIWVFLSIKGNLPNELIIEILYKFRGFMNPITYKIENYKYDGYRQQIRLGDLYPYQKHYMLSKMLNRSEKLIDNVRCMMCTMKYTRNNFNASSVMYSTATEMFKSYTQTLLHFEKKYGKHLDKYICHGCLDVCDYHY